MKRIALIAVPAPLGGHRPAPGSLDGDALRARLPLEDTGFRVVDVDPKVDFAEQLEELFDRERLAVDDELLIYASCGVMISEEGELFVCLDPNDPATGDSLRELALVVSERMPGRAVFVLECRHEKTRDPFHAVAVVAAAKEMVRSRQTGVGLLVAARLGEGELESRPSPLTRALLSALDRAHPEGGLSIEDFYEEALDELAGVVPGFAHAKGKSGFQLFAHAARTVPPQGGGDAEVVAKAVRPPPPPVVKAAAAKVESPAGEVASGRVRAHAETPERTPKPAVAESAQLVEGPASRSASQPPIALPKDRSFQRQEPQLPKVMISDRPPPPASTPPPPPVAMAQTLTSAESARFSSVPPGGADGTAAEHVAAGDRCARSGDGEGALVSYKRALVVLGPTATAERSDVYVRIALVKNAQDKRREAISNFEKALSIDASNRRALEALIDLNEQEGDLRSVAQSEDRLLATMKEPAERFARVMSFVSRWQRLGVNDGRTRQLLDKARALRPEDPNVLEALVRHHERAGAIQDVIETRRTLARLATTPRARAEAYADLASYCLLEQKQEELALELFDLALESDPSLLDPLTIVARLLADRQEWGELERAYRRMLERAPRIPEPEVRTEVTWELCRRLGLLYRDHLEDPALALDAFEDAAGEKPYDASTRIIAADLARALGQSERALPHLQALAAIDPSRHETFHELFELFQRSKQPDQAYSTACVTTHLGIAESRERFIYEEHRPHGVPTLMRPLRPEAWDLLRVEDRDKNVEAVFGAITNAAIEARLAQLAQAGKLPALDPASRHDPQKSTASIVRSFAWASHFLGVPAPAIYVHEDAPLGVATIIAQEPSVVAGSTALRGRSVAELAFLVGRHLAYHVGAHRLLLYCPSLEELTACFVAAVTIASPGVPLPASIEAVAIELRQRIEPRLAPAEREALGAAVRAFEAEKKRANVAAWAAAVERCATRAGYIVAADLDAAIAVLRSEPRGLVDVEAKVRELFGFAVSDAHKALRQEFGIAIEP